MTKTEIKISLLLCVILLLAGCTNYSTKAPLEKITEQYDPSSMQLQQGPYSYAKRASLEDGTELGIIWMKDGSSSKYWFRSHHLVNDIGGTWFSMSDGRKMYMAGYSCCEIALPKEQFESLSDLRKFVRKHHGRIP